ncbi:MAG: redoxin family protein [Nitrosopumilus sp.]|nr:redoxin family protein [Nitrosopumilus sp.]
MNEEFTKLPEGLPQPIDDGASNHLLGMTIPHMVLPSTKDSALDISKICSRYKVLYFFPMIAVPGEAVPSSGWNDIPGARGCTLQNISMSKHNDDLQRYDAASIGISTQSIDELTKVSSLRKFLQPLVSDSNLEFQEKLNIPTFQFESKTMYKRLTLIVRESKIVKMFYPIFPPDKHIFEILEWLGNNSIKR